MYPENSLRMKMNVISVLLEEIYVTKDNTVRKCGILIEKAKSLRAQGVEKLDECIQCLSDVISTLVSYMLHLVFHHLFECV